jgi:hypothetical protein
VRRPRSCPRSSPAAPPGIASPYRVSPATTGSAFVSSVDRPAVASADPRWQASCMQQNASPWQARSKATNNAAGRVPDISALVATSPAEYSRPEAAPSPAPGRRRPASGPAAAAARTVEASTHTSGSAAPAVRPWAVGMARGSESPRTHRPATAAPVRRPRPPAPAARSRPRPAGCGGSHWPLTTAHIPARTRPRPASTRPRPRARTSARRVLRPPDQETSRRAAAPPTAVPASRHAEQTTPHAATLVRGERGVVSPTALR